MAAKIADYRIEDWAAEPARTLEELPTLVHGREFAAQMRRFLPSEVHERTLARPEFLDVTARELRAMLVGGGAVDGRAP